MALGCRPSVTEKKPKCAALKRMLAGSETVVPHSQRIHDAALFF
jgi:hypothetical protein